MRALTPGIPRELPAPFNGAMVRSILDGLKTQTRRPVAWVPMKKGLNLAFSGLELGPYASDDPATGMVLRSRDGAGRWNDRTKPAHCPFGKPGDLLYVRERTMVLSRRGYSVRYEADGATGRITWPDRIKPVSPGRCMPNGCFKEAARLWLRVVAVRVERLQEITEEDARAEGAEKPRLLPRGANPFASGLGSLPAMEDGTYRQGLAGTWSSIYTNGKSWDSNPWVWVVTFERVSREATL